jgi:hypothetical protein
MMLPDEIASGVFAPHCPAFVLDCFRVHRRGGVTLSECSDAVA